MKRRPIVLLAMLLPILASVVATVYMEPSYAQDRKQGLYFEQKASAGGVEVRRMYDSDNNGVFCYVAKVASNNPHPYAGNSIGVAISCVKANP